MQQKIDDLNISNKAKKVLHRCGVDFVYQLDDLDLEMVKNLWSVGEKTFFEIKRAHDGEACCEQNDYYDEFDGYRLSTRAVNALHSEGVYSLKDLPSVSLEKFKDKNNIGKKTFQEIKNIYKNNGIGCTNYSEEDLLILSFYGIDEIGVSEKTSNKLKNLGIKKLNELVLTEFDDKEKIKNIGETTLHEIEESFKKWFDEKTVLFNKTNSQIVKAKNNSFLDKISNIFEESNFTTYEVAYQICLNNKLIINDNSITFDEFFMSFMNTKEMKEKLKLAFFKEFKEGEAKEDNFYNFIDSLSYFNNDHFSIFDYFLDNIVFKIEDNYVLQREELEKYTVHEYFDDPNDQGSIVLYKRVIENKTLQMISEELNITKTRVGQVILKKIKNMPQLREDYFRDIFEYFNFSKTTFIDMFKDESIATFDYLASRYKKGKVELNKGNADLYNGPFKMNLTKYFEAEEMAHITKNRIIYDILLNEHDAIDFETLEDKFYDYVNEHNLNKDKYKINNRTLNNMLRNAKFIVFNKDNNFRYLDIDYEIISNYFDFSKYKFSIISSELLFKNSIEMMNEFDIRDEYELFYVLKYAQKFNLLNYDNVRFRRVPTMVFDEMTDEKQIIGLLREVSPITTDEFYSLYEERYGYKKENAIGNLWKFLIYYLVDGKYVIDVPLIDERELDFIKQKMSSKSLWFIDEIKQFVDNCCVFTTEEAINSGSLLRIGYKLFPSGYILNTEFSTSYDYFDNEIFNGDIVNLNNIDKRISELSIFGSYLDLKKRDLSFIEVDKRVFMSADYFCDKYRVNKHELPLIQEKMLEWCEEDYFNSNTIVDKIKSCSILSENLKEAFLKNQWMANCFMRQKDGISSLVLSDSMVLSRNVDILNVPLICEWIVKKEGKMTIEQLTQKFNETFCTNYPKYKIAEKVRSRGLWNELMNDSIDSYIEELMKKTDFDKEDFFEEDFF